MARYIDAIELVKAIEENQRNTEHHKDGRAKQIHVNEHRHFIKMVYEQPTADVTPKSAWISVDERLPEPFVSVLTYMPGEAPHPTVHEGYLNKRGKWYAGGVDRLPDEVVMWMPMPEPPKGE
jgi:hypothetical protein